MYLCHVTVFAGLDIKLLYPVAQGTSRFEKLVPPPIKVTGPKFYVDIYLLKKNSH